MLRPRLHSCLIFGILWLGICNVALAFVQSPAVAAPWGIARLHEECTTTSTLYDTRREFLQDLFAATATAAGGSAVSTNPTLDPVPRKKTVAVFNNSTSSRGRTRTSSPTSKPKKKTGEYDRELNQDVKRGVPEEDEDPEEKQPTGKGGSARTRKGTKKKESSTKSLPSSKKRPRSTSSSSTSRKTSTRGTRSSSGSRSSSSSACFPSDARVEVLLPNQQWTYKEMQDLEVGDWVRSAEMTASQIYAFGTNMPNQWLLTTKLTLQSGAILEATDNHIIFTDGYTPKTMSEVQIGDLLVSGNGEWNATRVVDKEKTWKRGATHPYTMAGTIVVNDVVVSVHSIDSMKPYLALFGVEFYSIHQFQQLLFTPLRILYRINSEEYASEDNHDEEDGSHHWVDVVESLQQFLVPEAEDGESVNFLSRSPYWLFKVLLAFCLLLCRLLETVLPCLSWLGASAKGLLTAAILAIVVKHALTSRH